MRWCWRCGGRPWLRPRIAAWTRGHAAILGYTRPSSQNVAATPRRVAGDAHQLSVSACGEGAAGTVATRRRSHARGHGSDAGETERTDPRAPPLTIDNRNGSPTGGGADQSIFSQDIAAYPGPI